MSKIKNAGLDQYGAEPLEQQQFGTAGVQGFKIAAFLPQASEFFFHDNVMSQQIFSVDSHFLEGKLEAFNGVALDVNPALIDRLSPKCDEFSLENRVFKRQTFSSEICSEKILTVHCD